MSREVVFKNCPFCGAKIHAVIFHHPEPRFWANGLWFLDDTHETTCPLYMNELFGSLHFGKADNDEPTDSLRNFAKKWNRRAE